MGTALLTTPSQERESALPRRRRVGAVHLPTTGRGRAPGTAWPVRRAEVLAYRDVDPSTDRNALLPLVAPLLSGHSDVAIGTHELPVDWGRDGDSRVEIVPTAFADVRGIMRLLWARRCARDHRTLGSPRRPMLAP